MLTNWDLILLNYRKNINFIIYNMFSKLISLYIIDNDIYYIDYYIIIILNKC